MTSRCSFYFIGNNAHLIFQVSHISYEFRKCFFDFTVIIIISASGFPIMAAAISSTITKVIGTHELWL